MRHIRSDLFVTCAVNDFYRLVLSACHHVPARSRSGLGVEQQLVVGRAHRRPLCAQQLAHHRPLVRNQRVLQVVHRAGVSLARVAHPLRWEMRCKPGRE